MKATIHLKNGTRIKKHHVRYISAKTDNNQLYIMRYIYSSYNTRRLVEEFYNLSEVEHWAVDQPEKGGW